MSWLTNEVLFYAGIIVTGCSVLAAIICFCVVKIRFIKLHAQLKEEYGEKENKK